MKEIKFRAWDNKNKIMLVWANEGSDFKNCVSSGVIITYAFGVIYNDLNMQLMQYIGLKDKNGKEIYEGDITQCGIITFSRGKFQGTYCDSQGNLEEDWEEDWYTIDNIEVIGNIYENPELLEQVNEETD